MCPQSRIEILSQVLIIVVCNIHKAISLTTSRTRRRFASLIILEDAIASFSARSGRATLGLEPLLAKPVREVYMAELLRFSTQYWNLRWQQERPSRWVIPMARRSSLLDLSLFSSGFRKLGKGAPAVVCDVLVMLAAVFILGNGGEEAVK